MKRKTQNTAEQKAKKAKTMVIKVEMSMPAFKKAVLTNYTQYTPKQILKKFTNGYESLPRERRSYRSWKVN